MTLKVALMSVLLVALLSSTGAHYDRKRYKLMVYHDISNDGVMKLNPQKLINAAGFQEKTHYSVADDGYVTQLIRLINPKVSTSDLRPIPLIIFHGLGMDQSIYLAASSKQHHPEHWPRSGDSDQMSSSSRSLAFFLANNGFDVWLVGSRASNRGNQGFVDDVEAARANYDKFVLTDEHYEMIRETPRRYFNYSMDEIIQYEVKEQVSRVKDLTKAREISIFSFSMSAATTMAFLAQHREFAEATRVYIQQAPSISADHFSTFGDIYFENLCTKFPARGVGLTPFYGGNRAIRKMVLALALVPKLRYTIVHKFLATLLGPSLKYSINLERNLLARIFQPVSFKTISHYCLSSRSKQLSKYDYGKKGNMIIYGQTKPPVYDTSELRVQNYVVLSGTYDILADATTVQRLIEKTRTPKPAQLITVQGANHLYFVAGTENHKYVNQPILEALEKAYDAGETSG